MATSYIFGAARIRRHERHLLFALAFDNGFDDREAAFRRLNGIIQLHRAQIW